MRLAMRQFFADHQGAETVGNAQPIEDEVGIGAWRVGHRRHGQARRIGQVEQFEQTRHGVDFRPRQLAEHRLLAQHHRHLLVGRQMRHETAGDRLIGQPLQLQRKPRLVEMVPVRPKRAVEGFEMQRIGIGQCAIDIE
jgi:hypothetical protein